MTNSMVVENAVESLKSRIQQRQARIGIIGLGYVGLPLALLYSEERFAVTGFDIDQRKVDTLSAAGSYIFRIQPGEIRGAEERLLGYLRLRAAKGDGRHYHLCPDAVERISRAGPELHHQNGSRHCAQPSRGTACGAGEHDLSGHDRRTHGSHP